MRRQLANAAIAVTGLLLAAAFGAFGLRERGVSNRGNPVADGFALGKATVSTPLFSLRRIPSTVSLPLVSRPFRDSLKAFDTQLPPASCLVVEADGETMIEHAPDAALIPASNMKLLTAAVALEVLGADHTFVTKFYGDIADGVVRNLAIVGGGDPLLATPSYRDASTSFTYYADTPWTAVEALAAQLNDLGVTRVIGDVLGDGGRYDATDRGPGESVSPIGGLVIDDSVANYSIDAPVRAADPTRRAVELLRTVLNREGIATSGGTRTGEVAATAVEIAHVESQPLSAIVANMLTRSDNDTAEMLLREIALAREKPATRSGGAEAVAAVLASWGVPLEGVSMRDGSGLDRENKLTCRALVAVLRHVGPNGLMAQGLAVPGRPGTLVDKLTSCSVKDAVRAKTGSLTGVRALSGFEQVGSDHAITFATILNGLSVGLEKDEAAKTLSALCATFREFPGAVDVAAFGPTAPRTP
jgi:serine-type D-Ala-D-Ala carboxypeptidase/endopeptidase (penicillin-binding protein 4)